MATVEGTARVLQRAVERGLLHSANVRVLGATQLSCSAIGFGGYRVGGSEKDASHSAALRAALRHGVNLLDTSAHYTAAAGRAAGAHGSSERLIGQVLASAAEAGEVAREELVICTKVGHVAAGTDVPKGAVPIAQQGGGGDHWHSIDPEFVRSEVKASRQNLGTAPDFVLLHNPEYFLSEQLRARVPIDEAWDAMYTRLEAAFTALEGLCEEGLITTGYGVSANFLSCLFSTTGRSNVYEALALDRVVDAAIRSAGADHRMKLAQLPLNAFENGAVLGRGEVVPEAAEGDCELAGRLGLGLLTNRPLNALPMPGVSAGDWGRNASHLRLRDAKPMGAVESLLKRMLLEVFEEAEARPLQQLALQLALSAPSVSATLCGMRTEGYVQDAAEVLRRPPLQRPALEKALRTVRSAAEELGCQRRGLW